MLSLEIGELGEAGFDLSLAGFDEFELCELFAERTQGRTDPDDAPEPPAHAVALAPGQTVARYPCKIAFWSSYTIASPLLLSYHL